MALGILNADLIRGPQLGATVSPRPTIGFFAEKALRAVLVAVTVLSDAQANTLTIFADTIEALIAALARPSIAELLVE